MNNLKINEEFKNLIPPLTEEEKTGLEKSILMFGCRDKIITWNNVVIDGHNRYEICTKHNIEFEVLKMDYDFDTEEEVKQWIIKNQFARRNISNYQRSVLALQLKESIAKKAKENKIEAGKIYGIGQKEKVLQKSAKPMDKRKEDGSEQVKENNLCEEPVKIIEGQVNIDECIDFNSDKDGIIELPDKTVKPIDTREEIAKIAGVSHDTIHKVETIENEAPEVIKDAAKEDVISINKAYNITKEVKGLDEEEKKNKAEELLNQQYEAKAKQIDKEKKIADKIADAIYGVLTTTIDEERVKYYMEYSPQESLDKHISRCDEAISKLQELKGIFENMKKIKVVK